MLTSVFNELRVLCSRQFDSQQLLCVVFVGDGWLPERFRHPDLAPLGSRLRRRLHLDYAERDALSTCLDHLLDGAGNTATPSIRRPSWLLRSPSPRMRGRRRR